MSRKATFLEVDPTLIENNLRIVNNPEEEELNKLFAETQCPSKLVKPFPGFCVKTKELGTGKKVFINVCQTDAIPPPKDITERELEQILENEDETGFRIPMSIAEFRPETDKKGEEAKVCDVAIHPNFFTKIETHALFKQFFLAVVFEGLKQKFGLECTDDRIMMKNRKTFGTLQTHRIQQREIDEKMGAAKPDAPKPLIEELAPKAAGAPKIEAIASHEDGAREPEYRLFTKMDKSEVLFGEFKLPDVANMSQITLDVGEDRIVLESKQKRYLLDVFIPYYVDNDRTKSTFNKTSRILMVEMPIKGLK